MKTTGVCPKCRSSRIGVAKEGLLCEPKTLVRKRRQLTRFSDKDKHDAAKAKQLTDTIEDIENEYSYSMYVCGHCGYLERDVSSPQLLEDSEVVNTLRLEWYEGVAPGPYR